MFNCLTVNVGEKKNMVAAQRLETSVFRETIKGNASFIRFLLCNTAVL